MHCLVQYWGKNRVAPEFSYPAIFYEERLESRDDKLFDWDEIVSEFDKIGLGDSFEKMLAVGTGIDVEAIKRNNDTFAALISMLPRTMKGGTLLDVVKDLQDLSNRMWEKSDSYKEIRGQVKDNIELPSDVSQWDNVIERLDDTLLFTSFGRAYSGFTFDSATKGK